MTFFITLRKLFAPVKDDLVGFIQNIFEAICVGFYGIFSIEIMKMLLIEIDKNNTEQLLYYIYWYVGVTLIAISLRFSVKHWGWVRIAFGGVDRETRKYLERYIQADGNEIEKIGTGRFISIIDKGLYQWMDVLFDLTFRGVINSIMVLYAIYTIAKVSIIGGIVAIVLMGLSAGVATWANVWMARKRLIRRKEQNEANHQTIIALMSKNELLQNNGLDSISAKISFHLLKARKAQETVNIGFLIIEEFPRLTFLILRVFVYIFIAFKIFKFHGGIIELSIFITIMAVAEKSLNEFLHMLRDILREFSSISLLWSTFDNLKPIKGYSTGLSFTPNKENIILKDISYSYGESPIFRDFSLTIEKGKKTAFVGASGGGKTTLIKLIAGYLHPESGSISVMGNILSETALKTYYPHIGYLTQDPSVFDATIRENLLSALPENIDTSINEKLLIEALRHARCEFVFEMKDGLDTEIGERGVRLSGGQKQRLAIAKIFLKNPEIILLDEPTSALDSFSEEQITEALDTLFEGRTVIIVAHRLQTVKKADDIIVIEKGQVAERGTHASLTKSKGIYQKMLELQSGF